MDHADADPSAITASEESNSSQQGDSAPDSSVNGATESERFSSNSDNGVGSGGSDQGENEQDTMNDDEVEETGPGEKRKEVRRLRRVMANRRSAKESRERRKKLLSDLQCSVDALTSENSNLARDNLSMRQELGQLLQDAGLAVNLPNPALSENMLRSIIAGHGVNPEELGLVAGVAESVDASMSTDDSGKKRKRDP